jgi:hypothetical protein
MPKQLLEVGVLPRLSLLQLQNLVKNLMLLPLLL